MKKTTRDKPIISFIIPTYNAAQFLDRCLTAIVELDYPQDKIEVLIADGNSTDNTVAIAERHNATVLNNPKRIAEYGKRIAFDHSKGAYVVLLDADNVISSTDWLKRMLKPFLKPEVIGVESNYLLAPDFTSLNSYLSLLVIADPLARMLAPKPHKIIKNNDYDLKIFLKGSSPISGANGFIWRREIINKYNSEANDFNEVGLLDRIANKQDVEIGNVPGIGIYHYHCNDLKDFINKRKKIAQKHLMRSREKTTWVRKVNIKHFTFSILYLGTFIFPFLEAISESAKSRRLVWMWHPITSFITIVIYGTAFVMDRKSGS